MNINDHLPDFRCLDQTGTWKTKADFIGQPLIIYAYPKDMTPGCTAQACNLEANLSQLSAYTVIGVSRDSVERHAKFAAEYGLTFCLLSDPEAQFLQALGAWGEKKFMGKTFQGILRMTFITDHQHVVRHIIPKARTKDHAEQILTLLSKP